MNLFASSSEKNFLGHIRKDSELLRLTAEYGWENSPVGPIDRWPQSLKNAVSLILQNGMPMYLIWGKELTQFYNDGYIPILGTSKHPFALGHSGRETWSEIWQTIWPMWDRILATGESFAGNNFKLPIERSGRLVESYFSYSYSPICDDEGKIAGIFVAASELTEDVALKLALQAAHQESELARKKLHNFFMQAPVPMCIFEGPEHRYALVNPPYESFSGRAVTVGKTILEVFTTEEVSQFVPILDAVYETGNPYTGTHQVYLPDAKGVIQENWINIGYHPYRVLDGRIQGILAVAQDLTKEVRARKEAEEIRRNLQIALERGNMGIWQIDLKTNIVSFSAEAMALFLIDSNEVNVPSLIGSLMHPDDVDEVNRVLTDAISARKPYFHEYRIIRTDGQVRWLSAKGDVVLDGAGEARYYSGAVQDITDRKLVEQTVLEISFQAETDRKTLQEVFMQSSAAIAICQGIDFVFELVNLPYQNIVARTESHLIGKGIAEALPELEKNVLESFQSVFKTGMPFVFTELPATIVHGGVPRLGYYNLTVNPVYNSSRVVTRAVIIGYDVTEQVNARKTAEGLTARLRDALMARDEFLSIASHELKTPITSLKMQLQMIQRQIRPGEGKMPAPEKLTKALDISNNQIDRMVGLIEDMLDVAKVRAGKMTLRMEPVALSTLFKEIEERFADQFSAVEIRFSVDVSEDIVGGWDRVRLEQVLVNLASNAIKYAPGATVHLAATTQDGVVEISFRDSGPGIPEDKLDLVFDRFERAVSSRNISGLGLGLYISKQIVEAHGGTIRVESEFGHGTTFVIQLPVKHARSTDRGTGMYSGEG